MFSQVFAAVLPPVCAVCREDGLLDGPICPRCLWRLDEGGPVIGRPPPSVDQISSVAAHEGVARDILRAYKFGGLFNLAGLIGSRMAEVAPVVPAAATQRSVVPVPAAFLRRRFRGFDPAGELADRMAGQISWEFDERTIRRRGSGSQRGKGRSRRIDDPPAIRIRGRSRPVVILVDDVVTTGATLTACAEALRMAGAKTVNAVTFTRR
jgi:predicted amidophosphoribosyltransferase